MQLINNQHIIVFLLLDVNSDDSQGHNKITIAVSVTVFAVALLAIIIGVPVACLILIRKIMSKLRMKQWLAVSIIIHFTLRFKQPRKI